MVGLIDASVGSATTCTLTRTAAEREESATEMARMVTEGESEVAVPPPLVVLVPLCAYVKVEEAGTEAMAKVPLKVESETPAMVTLWPAVKPCAVAVMMVTTDVVTMDAEAEPTVAVPPLLEALAPVCENVNVVAVGTEAMVKVPLKLESEAPVIVTLWPMVKVCAEAVVTVTTLDERTAPLNPRMAPLEVMETVLEEGGEAGAVKSPLAEIVPTVLLPPLMSFTVQVTALFELPVTVAKN